MRKLISPLTGLATLVALCFSYVVKADAQSAQYYYIRRLVDGDTYELYETDGDGKYIQIRLACADTPETRRNNSKSENANANQLYWGRIAEARVTQLINQSGGLIWFNPNGGKSYNRAVGDVYLTNGTLVQSTLAAEGLAMLDRSYGNCNSLEEQAQASAQWYRRGVWGDSNFIAPWLFRDK
jgi:endonuclease YncB( thermonuclease family)